MNLALIIYLITRVDIFLNISWVFFSLIAIVYVGGLVILGCIICDDDINTGEKEENALKNWAKKWKLYIPMLIMWLLLNLSIPNSKVISAMYLIPKIANNEEVKKIPNNALKLLNGKLEKWLDDMTDGKGEE